VKGLHLAKLAQMISLSFRAKMHLLA
jgi:hypothetical protein